MNQNTEHAALRQAVREWLAQNVDSGWRSAMTNTDQEAFVSAQRDWFARLVEAGYATPHWPAGYPGVRVDAPPVS